jgi:hypothetical protein
MRRVFATLVGLAWTVAVASSTDTSQQPHKHGHQQQQQAHSFVSKIKERLKSALATKFAESFAASSIFPFVPLDGRHIRRRTECGHAERVLVPHGQW